MIAPATAETPLYTEGSSAASTETVKNPSKSTSSPEIQKLESSLPDLLLMDFSVPSVTGAQVPRDLEKIVGKDNVIAFDIKGTSRQLLARHTSIRELPKTRIITTFEPHLRQAAVKRLRLLVDEFRQAIGHPETAVLENELRSALTEIYKESISGADTRNFATAISILQEFLRPHWSRLSLDKLAAISERLGWLAGQEKLEARLLDKFYGDMTGVLGSRISFETGEDESEEDLE